MIAAPPSGVSASKEIGAPCGASILARGSGRPVIFVGTGGGVTTFLALAETLLGGYVPAIGGDLSLVTAIAILLVVLAFRPQGLLGRRRVARL